MLIKLEAAGVQVEKIVGNDISTDQIDVATKKHSNVNSKLKFEVQDVSLITDQSEYDVVISLFGLHWIADINTIATKIHEALKPDGKLMYFVPLEKMKLFDLRAKLVNSSEWQSYFANYQFLPFRSDPQEYMQIFSKIFEPENLDGISGMQTVEFTEDKFKTFLSSWMQELRHLHDAEDKQKYLDKLTALLPDKDGTCNDVEITKKPESNSGIVYFHELFFWFHGKKRTTTSCAEESSPSMSFTAS